MHLTDIQNKLLQLLTGSMGCVREEVDPHVVVGVLLDALKNMPDPLFHESYAQLQDIGEIS